MSRSLRPSGWIKQSYDRLILIIVLLLLLASTVFLVLRISSGRNTMQTGSWQGTPQNHPVEPVDDTAFDDTIASLDEPYQIPADQRRMMVGELRVASIPDGNPIPFDALVDPFSGTEQPPIVNLEDRDDDGDSIPNIVEEEYGLNPLDPTDAALDSDGDDFSNLEEINSNTDPMDPDSYPPPAAKLRLVRLQVNPFKLRFVSRSSIGEGEEGIRYQLNLRSLERTYFVKMSEQVEGYTVEAYEPEPPEGQPVLVLSQGSEVKRLVQGRVIEESQRVALMILILDGSRYRAVTGDEITIKDRVYKVIDIRENGVVIRDVETGKETEVGRLTEEEREQLMSEREPLAPQSPMNSAPGVRRMLTPP